METVEMIMYITVMALLITTGFLMVVKWWEMRKKKQEIKRHVKLMRAFHAANSPQ